MISQHGLAAGAGRTARLAARHGGPLPSPATAAAAAAAAVQQHAARHVLARALHTLSSSSCCQPLSQAHHHQQQQGWRHSSSSSSCVAAAAAAADSSSAAAGDASSELQQQQQEWTVLNFYHLVDIPDPDEMLGRHKAFIAANNLDTICGRIYISRQGINCQGGGTRPHAEAYVAWVASQPEFAGLFHTLWPADGPMFPRLRLKLKPNLISLAGGMSGIPVTRPEARATPLSPAEWREMMARAAEVNAAVEAGKLPESKRVVVMDLRNDYEWDAGHFDWAPRPDEEVFAETPVPVSHAAAAAGAPQAKSEAAAAAAAAAEGDLGAAATSSDDDDDEDDGVPDNCAADDVPSPLQGADPENTQVLMYCTGGIRCDVYSALLRSKGYKNLYTLHGGVQHYLREEGADHWRGSLFVFDGRMAINPALPPAAGKEDAPLPAAAPCALCGGAATLPHINCANMDCNELFLACSACKTKFHGCCCEGCQAAPRLLRPIKLAGGNYGSWNQYADETALAPLIATKRSREGRVARRARRRAALKAKRDVVLAERRQMRQAMKEAVRAADAAAAAAAEQQQQRSGAGSARPDARQLSAQHQ